MSRDKWERLVSAVVRRQHIWELCHDHSRTPSISTIPSDDDDDHFNEQFLDIPNNRWREALSVSPPAPLLLNNPPSVYQVGNKSGGAITRKLFHANWYRGKKTKQEYRIDIPGVATFPLKELQIATDNFADTNVMYNNGFAKFYRGQLASGILVAVKRYIWGDISTTSRHLQTEVATMSVADVHPNLLRMVGVSVTQQENLLVYPYMTNGSVAQGLRERPESRPPFDWPVRKHIAVESAKGLAYLHDDCDKKIIYRDFKAANIFLNNKFEASIGNFEIAILMDHGVAHVEDAVRGRIGHITPKYLFKRICSEKTDVFAYGNFLLELITGQTATGLALLAYDKNVKTKLEEKKWEMIFYRDCRNDYIEEEVEQLTQIALLCAQNNPEKCPRMSEIVRMMLQLGDGDALLTQKWEEFDNEARQELMDRSDEQWDLMVPEPDSPRQSVQLSSPR